MSFFQRALASEPIASQSGKILKSQTWRSPLTFLRELTNSWLSHSSTSSRRAAGRGIWPLHELVLRSHTRTDGKRSKPKVELASAARDAARSTYAVEDDERGHKGGSIEGDLKRQHRRPA